MDADLRATAKRDPAPTSRRRVAIAAALATTVEWYDYLVFGIAAALVFGEQFFPTVNPVAGTLASFATFAIGFAARPLGGIVAGHLGDKHGRRPVLVGSLAIMGVATTLIGMLPSYASVGLVAPAVLVTLRIVQGIAVGAMWGGAMLLATEYAPEGQRGLYGSLVQMSVPFAVIIANLMFLVLGAVIPGDAFADWGWRMPFLVGIVILALAWFFHTRVEETPEFRAAEARLDADEGSVQDSPLREILRHGMGTVLLAGGSFAVNLAMFYILVTGLLDYTTRQLGMQRTEVLTVTLLVNVTQLITIPAAASLSDRIGRLRVYAAGTVGLVVWAVPMFLLIDTATIAGVAIATFVGATCMGISYGPQAALFTELFDARTRCTGASMGYQLSAVLGGGLAPFIMVLLLDRTHTSMSVSAYIIVLGLIALLSIAVLGRKRARRAAESTPAGQRLTT
jgi:MFS family permease